MYIRRPVCHSDKEDSPSVHTFSSLIEFDLKAHNLANHRVRSPPTAPTEWINCTLSLQSREYLDSNPAGILVDAQGQVGALVSLPHVVNLLTK